MTSSRFERLEREHAPDGDRPERPSRVESRFSGSSPGQADGGPARSGAPAARFEEPPPAEGLRVLETEHGQAFVRCARCRCDNHVTASRCGNCEADLATAEQRAFNEALWRRLQAEKAEEEVAVAALRERRAAAEREQAGAMRERQVLEAELERRRELGLPLDEADDVSDPLRTGARALGRLLGRGFARAFPNRPARVAALAGSGVLLLTLLVVYPRSFLAGIWILLVVAGLARRQRRGGEGGWP